MDKHTDRQSHHFIVPLRYYVGTFIGLLFLTFLTVLVSRFDFGSFGLVVALLVAFLKAFLVAHFFMGLKWDTGFNRVILMSSLIFIGIFLAFTIADEATRGDVDAIEAGIHGYKSPVKVISTSEIKSH